MDEQFQNAAMYIMTSEMEGFPMVLLEAKSWGLPIISYDIMTGPSDIITNEQNGFLGKSYDSVLLQIELVSYSKVPLCERNSQSHHKSE